MYACSLFSPFSSFLLSSVLPSVACVLGASLRYNLRIPDDDDDDLRLRYRPPFSAAVRQAKRHIVVHLISLVPHTTAYMCISLLVVPVLVLPLSVLCLSLPCAMRQ
ncbi:hypothetical protein AcV5_000507 [Taiwanofungus camphoratus]|nr:hypothetical protein AcW2_006864 [Antrodia cinnamomea]KAI0938965.1 hypothetical protein AcV5_000507 [Antrodia cinnamomea]KAI0951880.1 hypothetical protein AcV7_007848 [Antrodia cinnamomea]